MHLSFNKTQRADLKWGFTSTELVTGLAALCLAVAVLIPVGAQVREKSLRSSCQSNLKLIGRGIAQYAQDYDTRLPATYYGPASSEGSVNSWRRQIYPYVKSTEIFVCPTNPAQSDFADDSTDANMKAARLSATAPRFARSYLCNGQIDTSQGERTGIGGTPPMKTNNGQRLSALVDSAHTILITEGGSIGQAEFPMTGPPMQLETFEPQMFEGHLETCNFLFGDGHVEARLPYSTGVPINMWNIEKKHDQYPAMVSRLAAWDDVVRNIVGQVQ